MLKHLRLGIRLLSLRTSRSFSATLPIYRAKMKHHLSVPIEPPVNRGMTLENFDKDAFTLTVPVLAASIPRSLVGKYKNEFNAATLSLPRVSSVVEDPDEPEHRLLLLDKADRGELPEELLKSLETNDFNLKPYTIPLGYDYWNATQILRAVLPEDLLDELPSSFTTTGHIAHFNLREEYLPYKHLIGQIVLEKNHSIETVVNKLDTIDSEFRFFQMEVMAGRPDFQVELSEGNCKFRLVDSFDLQDVIADGFAGVGPFAVPAAKKGCLGVLANDLNPASAESMRENVKINKLGDNIRCYNKDGREFFKAAVVELYKQPFQVSAGPVLSAKAVARKARQEREAKKISSQSTTHQNSVEAPPETAEPRPPAALGKFIDHFVLNLPDTAINFLDAFQGIYRPLLGASAAERELFIADLKQYSEARCFQESVKLPMVHCYCFTKELETYEDDINARATKTLGYPVSSRSLRDYSLSLVRSVAPNKDMYRLSFRLPPAVVFGERELES